MSPAAVGTDPAQPGVLRVFNTRTETKHYYDKIAKIYDVMADHSEAPVRQAALDLLAAKSGEKILEVGFGTGHCLITLAKAVGPTGRIYGIDISEGMRNLAEQNLATAGLADRAELVCGDGLKLPYRDGMLDAIFMSFTLELFDTPEIPVFLGECKRILRSGGRIAVAGMSKVGKHGTVFHMYEWTHKHFPNFVDCRPIFVGKALVEAGFDVIQSENRDIWVPVEVVVAKKR